MNPTGEVHTVEWDSTMCVTNSAGKETSYIFNNQQNNTLVSALRKSNFKWHIEQL